ncbi:hypothetical protein QUA42_10005 [Microcoleus sp. Pol11C2]|uniref:hypothetical protein n=1 Tax=Microcoleus sp. Pol11C2 TaxID=3055389 RepID=UPI002FD503FF
MQRVYSFTTYPKRIMGLSFLMFLVTLLGCSVTALGDKKMQVEVDMFSGRPNPHWELTVQESREFSQRFQSLSTHKGEGYVNDGLGYRGLIVRDSGEEVDGEREIVIYNGLAVTRGNGKSQQFTDKNRTLERWLIQTGEGRLEDELYHQISKLAQ